ncbi:cupin domain-containing protein [Synechococcus sp. J7-Johnson]|uniref:cupin domain-containing protein n=1 Tax=Synechococcus sp. J7-Johnson TaxID=2823737 RepID=UPI0028F43C6C|nr:cupin domain-containing protein [Synechococcus sp. J7-Johnson]
MSEQALPTTAEGIEALVTAFEAATLPRARWTHEAHLAVALSTLDQRPFNAALEHLRSRIRAYNDATGTTNTDHSGYHETLTVHFLRGVSGHIASHPGWPLTDSLAALLASPLGERDWPLAAYSRARLESIEARRNWLEPDQGAKALWAAGWPPRSRASTYPAPFAALMKGREKRGLGEAFGLRHFGVNQTRLKPGARTALRHAHSQQDEFVYVLEGHPTLITDDGERELAPGLAAGFAAGNGNAHHLINRTAVDVVLLEIGDRTPGDQVEYPDDDLQARWHDGGWRFSRKDGTPW